MKDIKVIFEWAKQNGDATVNDRIIMKLIPMFIKNNLEITSTLIEESDEVKVSDELYELIKKTAQELVSSTYKEK